MPLAAFPKCFLDALCVRRNMTVDQWIDLSLHFDIDGLEFYWGFTPGNDPREWERLRKKVDTDDAVKLIHTVHGVGYVLRNPEGEVSE